MLSPNEVFKKHNLSTLQVTNNLVKIYSQATPDQIRDGFGWYPSAERHAEIMAKKAGSKYKAAAVISHLSPRLSWEKNVKAAYELVEGKTPTGVMSRSIMMAAKSLNYDDPIVTFNGPKTKAFYENIIGNPDRVTVDVWATRAAFGRDINLNKSLYYATEYAYKLAAKRVGITPREFQATVWTIVRK